MVFRFGIMMVLGLSFAQGRAQPSEAEVAVPEITVMGQSKKNSTYDFVPTVSEMSGTRLQRKKQSTLGETLSHETGVTSSFFGPNASRPILRGLDGERVRVLQNGTGVLDASAASQDHAVALDPVTVERVETIRGPAALLYGSSAVGGVVNVVTDHIPESAPDGVRGRAETRYSTVDQGRSGGATLNYGVLGKWAFHLDGGVRGADNYRVPGYARSEDARQTALNAGEQEAIGYVPNSFNRTWNGTVGSSYIFQKGFLGASYSKYQSSYGTVAERAVSIRMAQQRVDFAGAVKSEGWIQSVRLRNSYSDYKHEEVTKGKVGTTFTNKGDEMRVELQHRAVESWGGLMGVQANIFDFEALGDEAFLPTTRNRTYSAFVFEEGHYGALRPSVGLRGDAASIEAQENARFGPTEMKAYQGGSASLGFLYDLTPQYTFAFNSAYTERAPNYQELFANGPHVATSVFEVGSRNLPKEQSTALELSLRHKGPSSRGSVGVFVQDFVNFIALMPTGTVDTNSNLAIQNYQPVPARFYGAEAELRHDLPGLLSTGRLELEVKLDTVRAVNRDTGESLPRIPPVRETVGLIYKTDAYQTDIEVQRSEKATVTALNETETEAYTFVNLGAEAPIRIGTSTLSAFARLNNVLDAEARQHVSVLKNMAPLPGRNLMAGVQATF